MAKGIIRLLYRKEIDINSTRPWEKCAFNDSYQEYLMQSQLYNKDRKYTSFTELLANVPTAEKLHFLVSASITGYIRQFNGVVPDIINAFGKQFLPFKGYRFEIIALILLTLQSTALPSTLSQSRLHGLILLAASCLLHLMRLVMTPRRRCQQSCLHCNLFSPYIHLNQYHSYGTTIKRKNILN